MASFMSRLFQSASVIGALIALTATPAAAAPFCVDTTPPSVDGAFSTLQSSVEIAVGKPRDCAHFVLSGEILIQHLDTGALFFNASTGDATFTDGSSFWTLTADGDLSQSASPPNLVLPALLVDSVPPDRVMPTSPSSIAVAGVQVSAAGAQVSATPTPSPSVSTRSLYSGDPRAVALQVTDLPNGLHAWLPIAQDTSRLLHYQYTIEFGRRPDNGGLLPVDPLMMVNIIVADSIDHAQMAWDETYAKPGPGERAGVDLAPFTDAQVYAIAPNVIDVRARNRNVILQAVEVTGGRSSISLDDTVAAVRIMAARVDALAH